MSDQPKKRKVAVTLANLRDLEAAMKEAQDSFALRVSDDEFESDFGRTIPYRLREAIRRLLVEIDYEL